jgi:hypothetical protein
MSTKHLLNPADRLCWIEWREATSEFRVSVEGQDDADYWTGDADDAHATATEMARITGCTAIVSSRAAEHAARVQRTANLSNA